MGSEMCIRDRTKQTAHRLGELDYRVAAFTHGPEIRDGARETVRGLLASL